jgi:hypothetical protein
MIRHTAVEALYANAFVQNTGTEEELKADARKVGTFAETGNSRTSIAALIKIICNPSNSSSLRTTACDCLGEHIAAAPELAAYAAGELFARNEAGAPVENVFDALLQVIRETPFADDALFRDAVDALSARRRTVRLAAAERFVRTLQTTPMSALAVLEPPLFVMKAIERQA